MKKTTQAIVGAVVAGIIVLVFSSFLLPSMAQEKQHVLEVPFVAQVSNEEWVLPWSEACEEASLTMLEAYYTQQSSVSVPEGRQRMQDMITWENETFKKNQDTNAEEIVQLINHQGVFAGEVLRRPTAEQIIEELNADRPVIFLVDMYKLYQEPSQGDSFHVGLIVGVDEVKKQFLLHDPARQAKAAYPYARVMEALHDYNKASREADGEPTVILTSALPLSVEGDRFMERVRRWMKDLF